MKSHKHFGNKMSTISTNQKSISLSKGVSQTFHREKQNTVIKSWRIICIVGNGHEVAETFMMVRLRDMHSLLDCSEHHVRLPGFYKHSPQLRITYRSNA